MTQVFYARYNKQNGRESVKLAQCLLLNRELSLKENGPPEADSELDLQDLSENEFFHSQIVTNNQLIKIF